MPRFKLIFRTEIRDGAMGASWVGVRAKAGPDGKPVLTHGCSLGELRHEIKALKAELDDVLRAAKSSSAAYVRAKVAKRSQS